MATTGPMTELYQRYRAGEVTFTQLKQQVVQATEDFERSRAEAGFVTKSE